jgi:hexosaminidase
MVDAAREYLPLTSLKGYVILCRLYKLNHLHIHLTDDHAFSFPSTAYPEAAAKSQWSYTLAEMKELAQFAADRGVEIIGEIDVPGHRYQAFPDHCDWSVRAVYCTNSAV